MRKAINWIDNFLLTINGMIFNGYMKGGIKEIIVCFIILVCGCSLIVLTIFGIILLLIMIW